MKSRYLRADYQYANPYVWGTIGARVAGALSMLWFPWWGLMITYVFDTFDAFFLMQKAGYNREAYHRLDKRLDWVCYAVEFFIAAKAGMAVLFGILLAWRLIGQVLFAQTGKTAYFLFAPNMFEICYMWLVAAPLEHISDALSAHAYGEIFVALIAFKLVHEAWLHLVWPSYLKAHGFPKFLKQLGYHNVGY